MWEVSVSVGIARHCFEALTFSDLITDYNIGQQLHAWVHFNTHRVTVVNGMFEHGRWTSQWENSPSNQINHVSNRIMRSIHRHSIKNLSSCLPTSSQLIISFNYYKSLIYPFLIYGLIVWGNTCIPWIPFCQNEFFAFEHFPEVVETWILCSNALVTWNLLT